MTARVRATSDDLCLYFANTRYWRGREEPTETLNHSEDLVLWVVTNGGYDAETAARMKEKSSTRGAEKWLQQAIELREALFRVFVHMAENRPPAPEDLNALNRELRAAPPRNLVADSIGGAAWQIRTPTLQIPDLLAPILWSTADLLVGNAAQRVRQCANPECQWLFIDRSKGGTRRWCDMGACGNRAKASRHYHRKKQALATSVAKK